MKRELLVRTPIGPVLLVEEEGSLVGAYLGKGSKGAQKEPSPLLEEAKGQLEEYFAGKRKSFSVPLAPKGTAFQLKVWQALANIPYAESRSYADIALAVGSPRGFRAVGMAKNRNPLAVFLPCHRVMGQGGSLTGYGKGMETRAFLLELEQRYKAN